MDFSDILNPSLDRTRLTAIRSVLFRSAAVAVVVAGWVAPVTSAVDPKSDAPRDVPKAVRALEGTYSGAWTMYGIDEKGEVVKRMAWTDTMTAGRSEVTADRAYVATTDEMTFEGSKGPPLKAEGKEGYYLTKDGEVGDYFIETYGQVHRPAKLGDSVWSYAAPAADRELAQLGFPKGASGQHVVVKLVTPNRVWRHTG
jgi:hypothetical protein